MEEKSIFNALDKKNLDLVKQLIKNKPERINERDVYDRTPLIYACDCCLDVKFVEFLLNCKGIEINAQDEFGWTAFLYSVYKNKDLDNTKIFKALIKHPETDVNLGRRDGYNPLMKACMLGFVEMLNMLVLHKSIQINQKDEYGYSALYYAFRKNQVECCKILLENGADCSEWREWKFKGTEEQKEMIELFKSWRKYLIKPWKPKIHCKYPDEFNDLAFNCMLVWNRLEIMFGFKIPKDIKRLLIEYVADWFREIKDEE